MPIIPLPYFDDRLENIDTVIIHCVAHDVYDAIESFRQHEVSAHYLISESGKIYELVPEKKRAWHAGVSFWQKRTSLNHSSIGIELCSPSFGQNPYPLKQIQSLIRLLKKIKRRYHIKKNRILGHSDIAPERKADPGKSFPWAYLARHGYGTWYKLKKTPFIKDSDEKALLEKIGYTTKNLTAAQNAFIRHFAGITLPSRSIRSLIEEPYNETPKISKETYHLILESVAARFI